MRSSPSSLVEWLLGGLVLAVLFSRFFLPAESAAQGDTLWIVGLWMLCGLLFLFASWRCGSRGIRLDWFDASVALWIGGQIVSALVIVTTVGHKRAAINMAWEWCGAGIVWFLLRHGLTSASFRRAMLQAMIVTGTVLGGLGLWQHYVSFPQSVAEYGPLFDRLRTATGSEAEAIKRKLAAADIPTEGPGLTLFEKRLRDSREPLGLFGLANTFGGCLAAGLVLTLGEIVAARRRGWAWKWLIPLIASAGIVAWCLLLTKSRTAWVGTACGVMVLSTSGLIPTLWQRRVLVISGLGATALAAVVALLLRFGGLDRQVVSEAPKSLAYRLQYWQATTRMVADHPWSGVGPGNFRQHYLKYKLPEASEEITDPHNLFLDVASTGGVLSLAGLVFLLGFALAKQRIGTPARAAISLKSTVRSTADRTLFWFAGLGAVLAFAGALAIDGAWEDRLLILAAIWAGVAWTLNWTWHATNDESEEVQAMRARAACAALVALIVHLFGAGGIAMPAVTQLLLALVVLSLAPVSEIVAEPRRIAWPVLSGGTAGMALMLASLAWSALLPVLEGRWWQAEGSRRAASPDGRDSAEAAYRTACRVDTWAVEPWQRRAEMAFEQAAADGFRSNESFESAVKLLREAMARDPVNFHGPRMLGNWWLARWQVTHNSHDAQQAAEWLQRACERYPTNAMLQAEWAFTLEAAAGNPTQAIAAARRALAQDDVNHRYGHVDRYLTADVAARLQNLLNSTP